MFTLRTKRSAIGSQKGDESPEEKSSPEKDVKKSKIGDYVGSNQESSCISLISTRQSAGIDLLASIDAEADQLKERFTAPKVSPFAKR